MAVIRDRIRLVHTYHVMLSREFFLCLSENYSFILTRICLNFKEIILQGTITSPKMGKQTNEAKEVYSLG